jgi:translocation and assembly module TamB
VNASPKKARWLQAKRLCLLGGIVLALAVGSIFWYISTDSFRAMLSRRLVVQLERITGGKAEIGAVEIALLQMRVELHDLTIHGLERPDEAPYFHAELLGADLKVTSFLHADFGFRSVVIDHPTLHLEIYPDGTTNQPSPKMEAESEGISQLQELFSVSINRLDVRHGTLLFGYEKVPLDFSIGDFAADTSYSLLHRRYDANVLLGKAETKFADYQPVAWTAELHFSIEHNFIDLKSLRGTANGARIELSGKLRDFRQPKVVGKYTANLDLFRLATIARRSDLRGGSLQLAGQGTWAGQAFASSGTISTDNLAWRGANFNLRHAKMSSKFSVDNQRLTLSELQAKLFNGSAAGSVEVSNWLGTPINPKTHQKSDPEGTARFQIAGLSLSDIADAATTPHRPFNRIALAGVVSGNVQARWKGSPAHANTQISLNVSPPTQVPPNRLPLTATATFTYAGAREELAVDEFIAATRSTQLRASGTLAQKSSLRLTATTTNFGEIGPAVAAFGGLEKIPVVLHGRATFDGTLSGKLSSITVVGNAQANNFETVIPSISRTPEQHVHWDELRANLQLSPQALIVRNGDLRRGAAEVSFDLNLGLQQGKVTSQSPVTLRLDVHHTDLAEVMSLTGYNYPVGGNMNLHAELSGTRAQPQGEGRVTLTNANAYGMDIKQFNAQMHLNHGELQAEDINLIQADEKITGAIAYNPTSEGFRFDLTGSNIDLATIPQLTNSRVTIQGRSDFTAKGSGTLDAPTINAHVRLRDMMGNNRPLGDSTFEATTQGADLHLTGHSQLEQAQLTTDGTVHLRGDWPCDIKLHFSQVNADPLLQVYMKGSVNSHSLLDGDLRIQGPLRRPRELKVAGDFSNITLGVGDVNIHNDGAVRFNVANQLLTIDPFHFTGERTDLTGNGTIQLNGQQALNFHTRGRMNLRLIESLNHDFTSSGIVTLNLDVTGSIASPIAQGRFEIRNGSIAYIDLPSALSEINGTLAFNQDRVQIETLTARTGGGLVQFQGFATVHNRQANFDLKVHGEDVRLRYPPGISSSANLDVRWLGSTFSSNLSGDVTVTRLSMSQGFDFASYLPSGSQTSTLPQTNPLLNSIRLNVHITTMPELQMQTTMLRLSGNADLQLRGTAAKPSLLGRADVTEGTIYFNGGKYQLERGEVSFHNPSVIQPVLDMQMTTRVRDYDVTVNLNGSPPDKLRLKYQSEPPLAEADIVSLLALGRTREESAQQQGNGSFSGDASNAILSEALNATVSSRVQNLFGGSRIKIDPQGLSTETTTAHGPQVTIEQQVTNSLTLTYSTNVAQSSQQLIQMEYNISRNLSILAVRDQNGVVSFDVRIRQRKK